TNAAKSIWDLLKTRVFYRAPSGSIADWVQKEIGEKRHKKFKDQYSYGIDIIRDGVQFSKDEINEFLVSYSDVQSLNDLECYVTLPGEWPVVRMKLTWKPYRAIAEGRIPRDVEDVFDPVIEATLSGETSDNQTGQIVGRLFGDTASNSEAQGSGDAPDAVESKPDATPSGTSPASENATPASAITDAQSAQEEASGRATALPPPVPESTPSAAPESPAPAPAAPSESERPLQVMDVVKHKSADFGLDRN
ncbi:type IV secretion system DNA-binding domain-containing protein, partial [Pantoea endophytica]